MKRESYDLVVLGGGPGGYVAAIRAGQRGLKTALVEAKSLGGACLHWGCIPAKAMLESAHRLEQVRRSAELGVTGVDPDAVKLDWAKALERTRGIVDRLHKGIELLERKNKVDVIKGFGRALGEGEVEVETEAGDKRSLQGDALIVATGSQQDRRALPALGSLQLDIERFFELEALPDKAAVWGGGPEAVELALLLGKAGVRTSLISDEARLMPKLDSDLGAFALRRLRRAGISVLLGRHPLSSDGQSLLLDDTTRVEAEFVLNLDRRRPRLDAVQALELKLRDGAVQVDDQSLTSAPGVYAVGDVTGGSMLAHAASAQALAAVAHIGGRPEAADLSQVPWTIYLYPEIASVGASEEQLLSQGTAYDKGVFPLTPNSRAQIEDMTDGFVKVLSDKRYGEVLGVHIVAPRATDMIAEAALAMRFQLTALEVARTLHAHPTMSEVLAEAHLGTLELPLHI